MSKQFNWSLRDYLELTDTELLEWFEILCDLNKLEAEEWKESLKYHKRG